jgi:hypothetical protein
LEWRRKSWGREHREEEEEERNRRRRKITKAAVAALLLTRLQRQRISSRETLQAHHTNDTARYAV